MNRLPHPRRNRLPGRSLVWTLALAVAACTPAATPTTAPTSAPTTAPTAVPTAASTGPLVVLEWSGYELPEFWGPFAEKHPDVSVEYSFFAEDAEAFAKLQSGFEADVIHPCSGWPKVYVDNGLLQPIDTSRLSNWPGVRQSLAEAGQVGGQQYLIPWDWGYESILVRTDKVSEIPDSWADLWDPQYAGHVTIFDAGETAQVVAALALGFDPWNTTPEQQAEIKQKLIDLRPNLLNYWSDFTELNQLVASGDVWVASNAWNDAYVSARDEGVPVEYITPAEGRLGWVCGFAISSKTKNLDLAYDYIDAALAPESMAYLSNEYGYGASNAEALPLTDPEFVTTFALDRPEILDQTVFYRALTSEQRDLFTSQWDEVKAAP